MPRPKKQHYKKQKDGYFHCEYLGHHMKARTEDELEAKKAAYKKSLETGASGPTPLVREYAAKWLPLHKSGVSRKCYNDYAHLLEMIFPIIGTKHFRDVTVDDAKSCFAPFIGYSQSTIRRARMLYIAMFDTAIENGLCTKNPFRSRFAQPDRGSEGTHRIITQEERDLILHTPHRMRLPALVMLYAGLRRGEALAIQIDRDVDFERRVIRVDKAVRFDSNQPILSKTKTAAGTRDVPLLPILADELAGSSGWLVQSARGGRATETSFTEGWANYQKTLSTAAGHPVKIRCHDLRHSYCTMLRDAGVDMKLAMLWMGHSDEKMILRIYDHVTDERAAEGVQRVMKRLENPL